MRVWMHRLSGCLLHPSNLERNLWMRVNSEPVEESQKREILRSLCLLLLTAAESLCAFNGVRFDIPFLHAALKLSETTAAWLLKTTDMLEAARLGLFGPAHTFGLNLLCQHNQVPVKSGSGLQAIKFAQGASGTRCSPTAPTTSASSATSTGAGSSTTRASTA